MPLDRACLDYSWDKIKATHHMVSIGPTVILSSLSGSSSEGSTSYILAMW